jgi:hypothetical protein
MIAFLCLCSALSSSGTGPDGYVHIKLPVGQLKLESRNSIVSQCRSVLFEAAYHGELSRRMEFELLSNGEGSSVRLRRRERPQVPWLQNNSLTDTRLRKVGTAQSDLFWLYSTTIPSFLSKAVIGTLIYAEVYETEHGPGILAIAGSSKTGRYSSSSVLFTPLPIRRE